MDSVVILANIFPLTTTIGACEINSLHVEYFLSQQKLIILSRRNFR